MKLHLFFKYPLLLIITSFFFFPFEFAFLPGINTKMALAALGLALFVVRSATNRRASLDRDFFVLIIFAIIVSLVGLTSVVFNNTTDYSYASYIVSFFVWMGGAYFVTSSISFLHGKISPLIVINYLISICVVQCVLALLISRNPLVKDFVDSFLGGNGFMGKMDNRMYGIGCALDVAGLKFSCVLVAISFVVMNGLCKSNLRIYVYWIAYLFVAVVGNMIGRTTSVGVVVSVFYMIVHCLYNGDSGYLKSRIFPLVLMITVLLPILVFLYNNNPQTREDLRFGFEGFFSLAETGKWETNSNNRLQDMFILPDNPKTWIIGDGYFDNPYTDPYYNGDNPTEYYKGTDVGYLRFIYYFGIIGLISFVVFFFEAFWNCASRHRQYAMLFLMLLLVNYIVWFKVSSDIFLIFALFFCVPAESEEGSEQNVMEK